MNILTSVALLYSNLDSFFVIFPVDIDIVTLKNLEAAGTCLRSQMSFCDKQFC